MAHRILRSRLLWAALLVTALVLFSGRVWLRYLGTVLDNSEDPQKADAALVLAGDGYGDRMRTAAELARRGLVPKVYVSGPDGFYGLHEDELAIGWAVRNGYPASYFIALPHKAKSTREEALLVMPRLRADGVRNLIVVTSDYHTARSGRIFRSAAPDMRIRMVAAPDSLFQLPRWWESREGRKTVFFEWTKTIADRVGL